MQSDDLPFVLPLLGAVSVGDERGVSARLEAAHRAGMDEMKRMVAVIARGATQPAVQQPVVTPDIMVTSPTFATITRGSSERAVVKLGFIQHYRQEGSFSQPRNGAGVRSDRSGSRMWPPEGVGGEWREVSYQRGRKPGLALRLCLGQPLSLSLRTWPDQSSSGLATPEHQLTRLR